MGSNTSRRGREEGEGAAFYHTNTTRCHISSNHDRALASFEFVQDPIAFVLLFVTVDGCRILGQKHFHEGGKTYREQANHPGEGSE